MHACLCSMYVCMHVCMNMYASIISMCVGMYIGRHVYMHICICHTGVVYNNISIMFMLWASSINNKVGLVQFAKVYLRYQSVMICRRWLHSLS